MRNSPFKACVFDAYGTLFDVHSAVAKHADLLGKDAMEISKLWRTKQLEYSWVHTLMRRHVDFWALTESALDYALSLHGVRDEDAKRILLDSYLSLDAYPEVLSVLHKLRAAGLKTAILSNGSPVMLECAVRTAGLSDVIDKCLSIEEVCIYKPDPEAYEIATSSLSVRPIEVAFFSSNPWDAAGAHTFGFQPFWVNRSGQPEEYGLRSKAIILRDLNEGVDHVAGSVTI